MNKATPMVRTSIPALQQLVGEVITFEAHVATDTKKRAIRLSLYSGAPVSSFGDQMIIDLSGMSVPTGRVPILRGHDSDKIIGHGKAEKSATELAIVGEAFRELPDAQQMETAIDAGFKFQASVGFEILQARWIEKGDSEEINERTFDGPGLVLSKTKLLEGSVVPMGRDSNTASTLLSANSDREVSIEGRQKMPKEQELHEAVAEFAKKHGDEVRKWKAEAERFGMEEGAKEARAEFNTLITFFGVENAAFVSAQFAKGNDLLHAKAEFADVLLQETKEKDKTIAGLRAKQEAWADGHDGVDDSGKPHKPKSKQATGEKYEGISDVKERAKEMWRDNPKCVLDDGNTKQVRDEFASEENLAAYIKHETLELVA